VVDSEDALQISKHKLETVTSKYELKISTCKMKTMALKERDPGRSKIVINNNVIKEVNTFFIYLGCSITYQNEKDVTVKISLFMQKMGIIDETLKQNTLKSKNTLDLKYITI
jgi:hypothetical protein